MDAYMTAEHVLVIDGNVKSKVSLNRGQLLTTQSLYEFSTIIWVIDGIMNEMSPFPPQRQGALDVFLVQRTQQLQEWVDDGHTLIIVGPTATPVYRAFADGSWTACRVEAVFPLGLVTKVVTDGRKLEAAGNSGATTLSSYFGRMTYRTTLASAAMVPLIFAQRATPGIKSVVGGYLEQGKGRVFFVPNFDGDTTDNFYRALAKLPLLVRPETEELPPWTASFKTTGELETQKRIDVLTSKRSEINRDIASQVAQLSDVADLKNLIAGTAEAFTNAVAGALRELGFDVVEGPNSRADLIASCSGRYVAIEAKGIEGAVKERQYRQVERWMAELNNALHSEPDDLKGDPEIKKYAECAWAVSVADYNGQDAKGLLIVATFRKLDLKSRKDEDFPDTVVRLLSRTDTCGLTGLQLFGLVLAVRADASLKEVVVKEILATRGKLERCTDWSSFLTSVP
jgi:hypothetical protein